MAEETDKKTDAPVTKEKDSGPVAKKKSGLFSRIWNGLFHRHGDDYEKRLQNMDKKEAAILARIKRRARYWRGFAKNLIVISLIAEVVAVGYAIMTTRTINMDWKIRALKVLPMFLLPPLSTMIYLALGSFIRMCDRKDQSDLERLRTEMQESLDELKEKRNYYSLLELIQKYDPDPALRAAAATILASRLGAVYVNNESEQNVSTGRSNDVELVQSSGLRNRKQTHTRSNSNGMHQTNEDMLNDMGNMGSENTSYANQVITEHYQPDSSPHDGGWFARIAALLVGEDPTQCFALICGNCHMHNGLARKEEYPYVTYYCPHCNALNRSNKAENTSGLDAPNTSSSITASNINPVENSAAPMAATTSNVNATSNSTATLTDSELVKSSPVEASHETKDGTDKSVSDDAKPVS